MSAINNRPVLRVTDKIVAYMGSRARVVTEYHEKSPVGLRTITFIWIDEAHPSNGGWPAGSTTRKVIKGDGRKANFQIIEPEEIVA